MNWYRLAKIESGNYILDPDGRLHPCHSHALKDCIPYVADQYNVLTESQDRYSMEYFNEVLDNGFAILSLGNGNRVNITNRKPLNSTQQVVINTLKKIEGKHVYKN